MLTACEIANSTGGIYVLSDAGSVSINGCNITGNGIGIMNLANGSVDATGNWWGNPAGPSGNSGTVDASGWLGGPVSLGY